MYEIVLLFFYGARGRSVGDVYLWPSSVIYHLSKGLLYRSKKRPTVKEMSALFLTMRQAAAFTGVGYNAIKSHRDCAHWIWECARLLSRPDAARPAYGWLKSELEVAALNLPRYAPATKPVRATDAPVMAKRPRAGNPKKSNVISLNDHLKQVRAKIERQKLRAAKRKAQTAKVSHELPCM